MREHRVPVIIAEEKTRLEGLNEEMKLLISEAETNSVGLDYWDKMIVFLKLSMELKKRCDQFFPPYLKTNPPIS